MNLDRADGVLNSAAASKLHVVVLGLGSVGSYSAMELAYSFRRWDLIDPDVLEKANTERHALDKRYVGRPKVEGVKELMSYRNIDNPNTIRTHVGRAQDVLNTIPKPDILIVAIDDPESLAFVNAWCVHNDVFAVYAGVYAKGAGIQIMVVPTPQDVCWQCMAVQMGAEHVKVLERDQNYGIDVAQLPEKMMAVPALRWVVSSVASEVARYVIKYVNGEEIIPHIFVRVNDRREILRPPSKTVEEIAGFIDIQPEMNILPLVTMDPNGDVVLHHSSVSHRARRWNLCPHHRKQERLSLSDI